MSYLCNAQFFETNSVAGIHGSQIVFNQSPFVGASPPVSVRFGGTGTSVRYGWNLSAPVWSLKTDLSNKVGPCYVVTIDLGTQVRATSALIEVEQNGGYAFTDDFQMNIECNISSPLSSDFTAPYTVDDRFFGRRASRNHFYALMPRNLSYRYYRIKLFRQNEPNSTSTSIPLYPCELRDIFVGETVDLDRPPARGLSHQSVDLSQVFQAESGREYFLEKPVYQTINGIEFPLMKNYQVSALKIWSDRIGISTPFFAVLDPSGKWDGPSFGASFGFFRLVDLPVFTHQFTSYWSTTLNLKEVL